MKVEQIAHQCRLSGIEETRYITTVGDRSYYCSAKNSQSIWLPFDEIEATPINPFSQPNGNYILQREPKGINIPPSIAKQLELAFPEIVNVTEKFHSLKHLLISSLLGSPLWDGIKGRKFKNLLRQKFSVFYASWTEEIVYLPVSPKHSYNDYQIPKIFQWIELRKKNEEQCKIAEKIAKLLLKCDLLPKASSVQRNEEKSACPLPRVPSTSMLEDKSLLQLYKIKQTKRNLRIVLPQPSSLSDKRNPSPRPLSRSPTY